MNPLLGVALSQTKMDVIRLYTMDADAFAAAMLAHMCWLELLQHLTHIDLEVSSCLAPLIIRQSAGALQLRCIALVTACFCLLTPRKSLASCGGGRGPGNKDDARAFRPASATAH